MNSFKSFLLISGPFFSDHCGSCFATEFVFLKFVLKHNVKEEPGFILDQNLMSQMAPSYKNQWVILKMYGSLYILKRIMNRRRYLNFRF